MTSDDVLAELASHNLPATEYVVVGGAALCIRGIRNTEDVDLVVTQRLYEYLASGGWHKKIRPNGKPGLKLGRTEAYLDVDCDSFQSPTTQLLSQAQMVRGVPLIDLKSLASFKAGYGRPKDLLDLALIAAHLNHEGQQGAVA